jgi:hypothetical protein
MPKNKKRRPTGIDPNDFADSAKQIDLLKDHLSSKSARFYIDRLTNNLTVYKELENRQIQESAGRPLAEIIMIASLTEMYRRELSEFKEGEPYDTKADLNSYTIMENMFIRDILPKYPEIKDNIARQAKAQTSNLNQADINLQDIETKALYNLIQAKAKHFTANVFALVDKAVSSAVADETRPPPKEVKLPTSDSVDQLLAEDNKNASTRPLTMVNAIELRMGAAADKITGIKDKIATYDNVVITDSRKKALENLQAQLAAMKIDFAEDAEFLRKSKPSIPSHKAASAQMEANLQRINDNEKKINNLIGSVQAQKITPPKAAAPPYSVRPSKEALNQIRNDFGKVHSAQSPATAKPTPVTPASPPAASTAAPKAEAVPPPLMSELRGRAMRSSNPTPSSAAKADTIITPQPQTPATPESPERNKVYVTQAAPSVAKRPGKLDKLSTGKTEIHTSNVNAAPTAEVKEPASPAAPTAAAAAVEPIPDAPEIITPSRPTAAAVEEEKTAAAASDYSIPKVPPLILPVTPATPTSSKRRISIEAREARRVEEKNAAKPDANTEFVILSKQPSSESASEKSNASVTQEKPRGKVKLTSLPQGTVKRKSVSGDSPSAETKAQTTPAAPAAPTADVRSPATDTIPDAPPLSASYGTTSSKTQGRFVPPKIDAIERRGQIVEPKMESAGTVEARMYAALRELNRLQEKSFDQISQDEVIKIRSAAAEAIEAGRTHNFTALGNSITAGLTSLDQKMVAGLEAREAAEQAAAIQNEPVIKIETGYAPVSQTYTGTVTHQSEETPEPDASTLSSVDEEKLDAIARNSDALATELKALQANEDGRSTPEATAAQLASIQQRFHRIEDELAEIKPEEHTQQIITEIGSGHANIRSIIEKMEAEASLVATLHNEGTDLKEEEVITPAAQDEEKSAEINADNVILKEFERQSLEISNNVYFPPTDFVWTQEIIDAQSARLDSLRASLYSFRSTITDPLKMNSVNEIEVNLDLAAEGLSNLASQLLDPNATPIPRIREINELLANLTVTIEANSTALEKINGEDDIIDEVTIESIKRASHEYTSGISTINTAKTDYQALMSELESLQASVEPRSVETRIIANWTSDKMTRLFEDAATSTAAGGNIVLDAFYQYSLQQKAASASPADFTEDDLKAAISKIDQALTMMAEHEKIYPHANYELIKKQFEDARESYNKAPITPKPDAKNTNDKDADKVPTPKNDTGERKNTGDNTEKPAPKREILRKLTAEQETPPPNPYIGLPNDHFKAAADRILDSKDLKRSATLLEYFDQKIIEAHNPNATNLGRREKLISDWNDKIFPLLERVNTRRHDLNNILYVLENASKPDTSRIKAAKSALSEINELYDKLYGDKDSDKLSDVRGVRSTIQAGIDKYGLDAIKINAHTMAVVTRKEGQTGEEFQAEIKRQCNALRTEDKKTSDSFTMQDKDFSVKLSTQAAIIMIPGTPAAEGSYIATHLPHLREQENTATVYSVQPGQISVHHIPEYLKLNNMLAVAAIHAGLSDRLPNPNPATRDQEILQLLSGYKEVPFSQKGLQSFLEVKVKHGEIQLPQPIAGMPRIGPTCRSMANEIYGNYLKIVRDPNNSQLPAPDTIKLALNFIRDRINTTNGTGKIPVDNSQNAELNRTVQLICEVMKRNVKNTAERHKFNYEAVGINNHEDFSRRFYQPDLIGAMQKAMMKTDPNFVANLNVTHAVVVQGEKNRVVQNTTFNLSSTENQSRVPTQTPTPSEETPRTPRMGRGSGDT